MFNTFNIEVLLYIPAVLVSYTDELRTFVQDKAKESGSNVEVAFVDELTPRTQIVLSLVDRNLGKFDKELFEKYQSRKFRFLFYYFQDAKLEMDDFTDAVYERVEFKDDLKNNVKLSNEFEQIEELKEKLSINIKESVSDLVNRTNYSKINSSVINRSKGSKFFDNDNNLRKVDNFLRREKRISLINGLGGVGKTTLAIEYAVQSLENEIYDYIIWLDVENSINNEVQRFTISYLISDTDDGKQGKAYYKKKFDDFITMYPNSLVILDNYDTKNEQVKKELNKFVTTYNQTDVVITSRESIPSIKPINLEVFQHIDDALEMFLLNSSRKYVFQEQEVLKDIIEHLGKLPLALEITANFLDDLNMDVDVYFKELKKESLKIFDKLDDYKPQFHLQNLRATLKINDKIVKNENSLNILKIFALISPEPIDKEIIENNLMEELAISDFDKPLLLKELEKFSYIKKSDSGYSMHRLLQEAILLEYFGIEKDNNQVELITRISLAIFHWFSDKLTDFKYGSYFDETKHHIDFILEKWEDLNIDEAKVYIYTCISAYIYNISEHSKDTLDSMNKAISLVEDITMDDNDKAKVYSQYAKALSLNSEYTKEEQIYIDILGLQIDKDILSSTYSNLASTYDYKSQYDKAIEYNNKSLELSKILYGENHPSIGIIYNNLGLIYRKQKKYQESERLYISALDISKNNFINHPEIAVTYSNLGYLYSSWKKYPQSFKSFYLALKMRLNLELSPINIYDITKSFNRINETKRLLTKLDKNQKTSINKQIEELNKLFEEKKLKHKLKKLK